MRNRSVAVVTREGKVLMEKVHFFGRDFWTLPGGGIEKGEDPEQAALRELKEECGLDGTILRALGVLFRRDGSREFSYQVAVPEDREPVLGQDPEFGPSPEDQPLREVKWMSPEELSEKDRAFLWGYGLMEVDRFSDEVLRWGDEISYPGAREGGESAEKGPACPKIRKTIITVQHTQSQHHQNGRIGAGADWELTEEGKKQAFAIGRWLLSEEQGEAFHLYASSLTRARQTAEEICRTLRLEPVITDRLREVDAGDGNGQTREWYHAHKKPETGYDPDYRPFENAESDRDLWERLYPLYRELLENGQEKLLLISHGTTLSFLQSMLMGYRFEDLPRFRFNGPGGSVSKFILEPTGKVTACYINRLVKE